MRFSSELISRSETPIGDCIVIHPVTPVESSFEKYIFFAIFLQSNDSNISIDGGPAPAQTHRGAA